MPIYEFCCPICDLTKEVLLSVEERNHPQICIECDMAMSRIFSMPSVIIDAKTPKTIGDLATRNTENLIKEGKISKKALDTSAHKERKRKQKKIRDLGNLSPAKQKRYIETGKM